MHVVRPRGIHGGRGGRSSGSGNGDLFLDKWGYRGQDINKGNRTWAYPPILNVPEDWSDMIDRVWNTAAWK